MGQKIILKHSTGTTTPTLDYGELAIKYLNGSEALYTKNSNNEIVAFNTWAKILGKPTTLSGYGITDAVVKDGDIIMNTNSFGGRPLYINSIDNAMFAASKKWYVTVTTHLRTYNSETYPKLNPSWVESYTVTGSGTAFNVSGSPTSIVVYNSDTLCSEVTTPTTQNQYKYVGGVLTFGATVTGTIRVYPGYDVKQYIDSPVVNTLSGANAFDGSYETTIGVSTGYYMKINIKFNESGTAGFSGGYPYGRYFLSYYYTETSEKAEYRVYNRTYRPHIIGWKKYNFTDFKGTNSSGGYIQTVNDGGNYGRSEIEFIVYGHPSHSTGLTQIDLKLDRPNLSVNGSTVTKYGTNKLYYDLQFGNQTSNNLTLYANGDINTVGAVTASSFVGNASSATKLANARTIWGQNFDGGANVTGNLGGSWFAINDVASNPYVKLLENSNAWYLQGYQNKLYLGSGTTNSMVIDNLGNVGVPGVLTANRINTVSESHMSVGTYTDPAAGVGAALKVNGGFAAGGNSYFTGGNVMIGTLTDSGYKLDVNGTGRFVSNLITNGYMSVDGIVYTSGGLVSYKNATITNSGTNRAVITQMSIGNVPTDYIIGSNNANRWSITCRDSSLNYSFGVYNYGRTSYDIFISGSTGNVGIGTSTDVGYKLDVNGTSRITGSLHLNNEGWLNLYNAANTSRISISHNSAASKLDIYNRTTSAYATVQCGNIISNALDVTGHISLYNDQTERFIRSNVFGGAIRLRGNSAAATDRGIRFGRVDNSLGWLSQMAINADTGNVMINTVTDANHKLDVNGTGRFVNELFADGGVRVSNSVGSGVGISLFNESSTHPNYGFMFAKTLYKGVHGAVNGDWATYFTMSPDAGRGWIFTNSASTAGGNIASISNTGNITASGEITAYSASDIRLKTDIQQLTSGLDIINKLNPVSYKWNNLAKELNPNKDDSQDYGLIAQELEKVLPNLVHNVYNTYKSIDYVKLVPFLVASVKELHNKNIELEKRIEELSK